MSTDPYDVFHHVDDDFTEAVLEVAAGLQSPPLRENDATPIERKHRPRRKSPSPSKITALADRLRVKR
jgi:hypothetical protein